MTRDLHQQLFFHISEVQLEPGQAIAAGAEVSFGTMPDTQGKGEGNPLAVRVQQLPEGTLQPEQRLGKRLVSA
jgi:cold shock CspA family protein